MMLFIHFIHQFDLGVKYGATYLDRSAISNFVKNTIFFLVDHYGFHTEQYEFLVAEFFTELQKKYPQFHQWLREAGEQVFLKLKTEPDYKRVPYERYVRMLRTIAVWNELSEKEQKEMLGPGNGEEMFENLLNADPELKEKYEQLIAEEKKRLEAPEMQKDLYAIVGKAIRTYEEMHFHFPKDFKALLPILRTPGRVDFHPRLENHDVSEGSLLYEQLHLQYLRHKTRQLQQRTFRAFGQYLFMLTERGRDLYDYPYDKLKVVLDARLKIRHPKNETQYFNLRADVAELDAQGQIQGLIFFPTGHSAQFPFEDHAEPFQNEEANAYLITHARLKNDSGLLVPDVKIHSDPYFAIYSLNPMESTVPADTLPAALKTKTDVMNIERMLDHLYVEEGTLEEKISRLEKVLVQMQKDIKDPHSGFDANLLQQRITHLEFVIKNLPDVEAKLLARKDDFRAVFHWLRDINHANPSKSFKELSHEELTKEIALLEVLAESFQILITGRNYNLERFKKVIGEPSQSRDLFYVADLFSLLRSDEIFKETVGAVVKDENLHAIKFRLEKIKESQLLQESQAFKQPKPAHSIVYYLFYDLAKRKYYPDTERDFAWDDVATIHRELIVKKRSELRASPVDAPLTSLEYGIFVANQNAKRELWHLSDEERKDIEALAEKVYEASTEGERTRGAKQLELYILSRNTRNRLIQSALAARYLPYLNAYSLDQQSKGLKKLADMLIPFHVKSGVFLNFEHLQHVQEALEKTQQIHEKALLNGMAIYDFIPAMNLFTSSWSRSIEFLTGVKNPKLGFYTNLAREERMLSQEVFADQKPSRQEPPSDPNRTIILDAISALLRNKDHEGRTLSSKNRQEHLETIRRLAKQSKKNRLLIVAGIDRLESELARQGQVKIPVKEVGDIVQAVALTLENPEEILLHGTHLSFRQRVFSLEEYYPTRAAEVSEPILQRLDDLLQHPENRQTFNRVIVSSFWARIAWGTLLQSQGGIPTAYPRIKETILENIRTEDPILLERTLSALVFYPLTHEKGLQKADALRQYLDEIFLAFFEHHHLNPDKFQFLFEVIYGDPVDWRGFMPALEKSFRNRLTAGEIPNHRKIERWLEILLTGRVRNFSSEEAFKRELNEALGIDEHGKTRFDRIVEQERGRSEVRSGEKSADLKVPPSVSEVAEKTVTYLLANRVPPRSEIMKLKEAVDHLGIRKVTRVFEQLRSALTTSKKAFAAQRLAIETLDAWHDYSAGQRMDVLKQELKNLGILFQESKAAEVALLLNEEPDLEVLISILKLEPALNLLVIWLPEADSSQIPQAELDKKITTANELEKRVNDFFRSEDGLKRLRVIVPLSQQKGIQAVQDAARTLFEQRDPKAARSVRMVQDRLVYVYPGDLKNLSKYRDAFEGAKSVGHSLSRGDKNIKAKSFVLLKTAAEISQETLSILMRGFLEGEGHYDFNDRLISTDLLASIMAAESEIEEYLARSA
jgi:hypothetical protein